MTAPSDDTFQARDLAAMAGAAVVLIAAIAIDGHNPLALKANFDPFPDGIEYAVLARNLATGRGAVLTIGEHVFRSRYAVGYPALLAPAIALFHWPLERLYVFSALLAVGSTCLLYRTMQLLRAGRMAAALAAVFWAANPLVYMLAGLPMSEMASTFFLLLASMTFVSGVGRESWRLLALSGFALGYASFIKLPNGLMIVPLALFLLGAAPTRVRIERLAALLGSFSIGLIAIAIHYVTMFGQASSGYGVYGRVGFSVAAFRENASAYLLSLGLPLHGSSLWLQVPPYNALIPALCVIGAVDLWRAGRTHVVVTAAAVLGIAFAVYASWGSQDLRFFVPYFPLIFGAAACGARALLERAPRPARAPGAVLIVALYLAYPPGIVHRALDVVHGSAVPLIAVNLEHVREMDRFFETMRAERDTDVLVTGFNLVYQDHYSTRRYTLAPLFDAQDYANRLGGPAGVDAVEAALAAGKRVFVSDYTTANVLADMSMAAMRERFVFEQVDEYLSGNARLYKLSRSAAPRAVSDPMTR